MGRVSTIDFDGLSCISKLQYLKDSLHDGVRKRSCTANASNNWKTYQNENTDADNFVTRFQSDLRKAHDVLRTNLKKTANNQKKYYDTRNRKSPTETP